MSRHSLADSLEFAMSNPEFIAVASLAVLGMMTIAYLVGRLGES